MGDTWRAYSRLAEDSLNLSPTAAILKQTSHKKSRKKTTGNGALCVICTRQNDSSYTFAHFAFRTLIFTGNLPLKKRKNSARDILSENYGAPRVANSRIILDSIARFAEGTAPLARLTLFPASTSRQKVSLLVLATLKLTSCFRIVSRLTSSVAACPDFPFDGGASGQQQTPFCPFWATIATWAAQEGDARPCENTKRGYSRANLRWPTRRRNVRSRNPRRNRRTKTTSGFSPDAILTKKQRLSSSPPHTWSRVRGLFAVMTLESNQRIGRFQECLEETTCAQRQSTPHQRSAPASPASSPASSLLMRREGGTRLRR